MIGLKSNPTDEYYNWQDEEENNKLQEIIDLLVAAGYFRARIKGLSPFDKVVGGMIWSMDGCSFDVNVDLLFQENSTIGQKIALTEKIVMVLPKMSCPYRIEPHQIQGLDFMHIFPVIQWLVKRSVKVREEKREFIRRHTIQKFSEQFSPKETDNTQKHLLVENIKKLQEKYRKRRLFKRKDNFVGDAESQVESTLLEYGFPHSPLGDKVHSSANSSFSVAKEFSNVCIKLSLFQEYFISRNQITLICGCVAAELLECSDSVYTNLYNKVNNAATWSVPLKAMGNLVTLQAEKIAQVSQQFAKLKMDIESTGTSLMMKQKDMMLEKKNALLKEEEQLEKEIEAENQKLAQIKAELRNLSETNNERSEKDQRLYDKIQSLILLEEHLKRQEQLFREHCKVKLENLQNITRDSLEKNQEPENTLADSQLQEEKEKVQELRLQIAKKNRAIAFLQRQLDEIPGRGELSQYQRRFLELYNEVAQKHEETKQFYTMYNTLDDTKLYLSKELSLLNSVLDNYSEAMSNAIDKEEFMTQFQSIVSAIKQNKNKVEKRRAEERSRRDKLSKQLLDLVEQQRSYVNIVKQLKIECKRNEELLAHFRKQV